MKLVKCRLCGKKARQILGRVACENIHCAAYYFRLTFREWNALNEDTSKEAIKEIRKLTKENKDLRSLCGSAVEVFRVTDTVMCEGLENSKKRLQGNVFCDCLDCEEKKSGVYCTNHIIISALNKASMDII